MSKKSWLNIQTCIKKALLPKEVPVYVLHHLMEYVVGHPSFKIKYYRGMKVADLLSWYADADWGKCSS
jgi:hypothetical protein